MKKNIFITGSTGVLGSHILKSILQENNSQVYLLIRGKNNCDVDQRGRSIVKYIFKDKFNDQIFKRIEIVKGDLAKNNLDIDKNTLINLYNNVDEIYHCAALAKFSEPLKKVRFVNVFGTKNILEFAMKCKKLNKINYISTAFIVGTKNIIFTEDDFDVGQKFNNPYEQSKFEAELLIREYIKKGLKIYIFRPSIIVGEYTSGEIMIFKMFYQPLRILSLEIFKEIPLNTKAFLNLIPVDLAAEAIYTLASGTNDETVYHITSPYDFPIISIVDIASSFFNFKKPRFITLKEYKNKNANSSPIIKKMLDPYIPYFNFKALFSSNRTQSMLKKYGFEYPPINNKFLYKIFKFCNNARFIKVKNKYIKI